LSSPKELNRSDSDAVCLFVCSFVSVLQGEIVEAATHTELMNLRGRYYDLVQQQETVLQEDADTEDASAAGGEHFAGTARASEEQCNTASSPTRRAMPPGCLVAGCFRCFFSL